MTIKKLLSFIFIVFFIISTSACTTSKKKVVRQKKIVRQKSLVDQRTKKIKPSVKIDDVDIKDYVIAEPDVLSISVWKEPELKTRVNVRPDGKISFPLIGDLYVRGLTPDELKQVLAEKLSKYIINPLVFVKVEKIESQRVFVLGAIANPQVIPLTHKTTLLEAITRAGGVKTGEFAGEEVGDISNAYVSRGNAILDVDFYKLLRENDMKQNIFLQSGDFIYIPFAVSPGSEVFVLGEVKNQGVKPLKRGATLIEIIAKAGGLNISDASAYINIVRGDLKNPKVITVNYKKIVNGDSENIVLKNHDIIYVSPTLLTSWNRMVGKILPTLQMALWPGQIRDVYTTGGGLRFDTGPTTATIAVTPKPKTSSTSTTTTKTTTTTTEEGTTTIGTTTTTDTTTTTK